MNMTSEWDRSQALFASDLYGRVLLTQGKNLENAILSPLSIYAAFIVTMAGTAGKTKDEMMQTLKLNDQFGVEDPHKTIGPMIMKCLQSTPDIELSLANRLFIFKDVRIREEYNGIVKKYYGAEAESLSSLPNLEAMRVHINDWVSKETRDKIKDFVPPGGITHNNILTVVNAVYFRGLWKYTFNGYMTRDGDFTCLDGSKITVNMMSHEGTYPYCDLPDKDAQAIKIPFRGLDWEMLIVLPNKENGLHKLTTELIEPGNMLSILSSNFVERETKLYLPRFKIEDKESLDITNFMKSLGMKTVFDPSANFSKLCEDQNPFVQGALHKAMIEVNEEGAVAAAATRLGMFGCSGIHAPPPSFRADHPFFFALIYRHTVPVFLGHCVKPET